MRKRSASWVVLAIAMSVLVTGCGSDGESAVQIAEAKVDAKKADLASAQDAATAASTDFCDQASAYITALDRYGDLLHQTDPTVGDVRDAGSDLDAPADDVAASADDAVSARADVVSAEKELAQAKTDLAKIKDKSAKPTPTSTATELVPVAPAASVTRVEQAQSDLNTAVSGVSDDTTLTQAAEQVNAAAVALEISWISLFADVGCLTDEQQVQSAAAVQIYTSTLQQALTDAGYYDGDVDGIYGPATVQAVESLQEANDLPVTGTVDKATEAALQSDLAALGGATEKEGIASTAALQQTLKLVGYWPGEIDGEWTPELTQALMDAQTELGVKPTGTVDTATIAAFQRAIAEATAPDPTPSAEATDETESEEETESPTPSESPEE